MDAMHVLLLRKIISKEEHVVDEGLSIFFGPLYSNLKTCEACGYHRTPPDTIMPGTESILLNKKHGQHICPDLYGRAGFQLGVTRRGLPCAPGFVLTDYKSQSRMERVLPQISRCQELEDKIWQL
jgi:hypothetical protein